MPASLERFLAFRRVPVKVVAVTAPLSYALQVGAIVQRQPLYVIALYTLLPWIPLVLFEGIWKFEHYNLFAAFALVTFLQVGHLAEHSFQMAQLTMMNGTFACPPPVDSEENARRAVELGLRSPGDRATGYSTSFVIKPVGTASATPQLGADGAPVRGVPACGVFGQLDFETVHLVWDSLVWLGALWLLAHFSRNPWLWAAAIIASLHEVEHLFLGWIFFLERDAVFSAASQVWATTVNGAIVTAHPVGVDNALTTFYEAGGKQGIMGQDGLIERLIGTQGLFPFRPFLHFFYNALVVIPTTIAFIVQARRAYDRYLAKALPTLTEYQLSRTTTKLQEIRYAPGALVVRQGDIADRFYIITKGEAEVLWRDPTGTERVVSRVREGEYFGEIGLLREGKPTASVRAATAVTALPLDRESFQELIAVSETTRGALDRVIASRLVDPPAPEGPS